MSIRLIKAQNDLQRALYKVFLQHNFSYAIIKNTRMSKDFRYAVIEVISSDQVVDDAALVEMLNSRISLIKRNLRRYINFKYFPDIRFSLDEHKQRIEHTHRLLETLAREDSKLVIY